MSDKTVIPLHEADFKGKAGVAGFISWNRLEDALRLNGELDEGECIAGYVVDDGGISFYIEKS